MADRKDEVWYENKIIRTPDIEEEPDRRGIGYVYYECMSKNQNLLAQIDGSSGEQDTFGALLQRCIRSSIAMRERGVNYGDIVSVCTYNHLNSCVPHISTMFIGGKIAALDPSLSLDDATYLFQQVMPKLIFTAVESVTLIENVIKNVGSETIIVVFGPTDKHTSFNLFMQPQPSEDSFTPVEVPNNKDVAIILFSSGTTGLPKGICHTHYSILKSGASGAKLGKLDSLTFASDSPYWNVFLIYLNNSIRNGGARLIYPEFDLSDPWKIFKHKVTMVFLDITRLLILSQTEKPKEIDVNSLKLVTVAGTTVSEDQMRKIRNLLPNAYVRQNYGQSEVFPNITLFDVSKPKHCEMLLKKQNSCGYPKRGISYKVVDPISKELLGPNQNGEICLKTDMQLCGYYASDSSEIWDSDGWLKTGDYGYYDDDFCFYIVDRIKETFRYRDWPIIPAVIEGILHSHPAVFRSAVIGIPHYLDNHHAMGVVVLNSNAKNITAKEIEKYVEDKVEDRSRLRAGVRFVNSFPLTPSGKIYRLKLKNMILKNEI